MIAGASVLVALCVIFSGFQLRKRRKVLLRWLSDTFRHARFYDVLKTFCGEAAVLWLVFPIIDVWERGGPNWIIVYISPVVATIFLILAGIAARKEDETKNSEALKK